MSQANATIIDLQTESALVSGLNDIAAAIGKFRVTGGSVTVSNGAFTLSYEGEAPQNAPSTATIIADIKGTNQTGLSYAVTYSGGVATFTLSGTADGVYTQAVSAVIVLGDDAVPITITGLPVMYAPLIEQPTPLSAQVFEWDYSVANTIDFSPYVFPKNVNAQIGYNDEEHFDFDNEIDVFLFEVDDLTGVLTPLDFNIYLTPVNSFTFTIPANTLESGKTYLLKIAASTGLLGDNAYSNGNAEIAVYEQEAE